MRPVSRHRRASRAVTPIFATLLIVAMTITAGAILWTMKINTPSTPVDVNYIGVGDQSEPAWGDPTDCTNTSINANCGVLPAIFIVFTGHEPTNIPLTLLLVTVKCNSTSLLNGTLASLEVVPGTGASPGVGAPKLGHCGTWYPSPKGTSATYFNRLLYFQQIQVGSQVLINGDQIVLYTHPHGGFCDRSGYCPDDDFHGAPPWCFTIPNACFLTITYLGTPQSLVANIPILLLGRT